jgi:hypothetical protein
VDLLNPLTIYRGDLRYIRITRPVDCLAGDAAGDPVYLRADIAGGQWQVGAADPDDYSKMPSVGVLISKATATTGQVQTFGPVSGVYSELLVGRAYYVISGGVSPVEPAGIKQAIGISTDSGELFLPGNMSGASMFDASTILVERTTGLVVVERTTGNVLVARP